MGKQKKSIGILILLDELFTKKILSKHDFCVEYQISNPTFERYISDLRSFLQEKHPEYEIIYDSKDKIYRLVDANL